jgi:DNA-directed RNA polymerase subunit RPC12/RpoP
MKGGKNMNPESPSGIYKCIKCGNEETHVKDKRFAPCSKCGTNSWKLVRQTR